MLSRHEERCSLTGGYWPKRDCELRLLHPKLGQLFFDNRGKFIRDCLPFGAEPFSEFLQLGQKRRQLGFESRTFVGRLLQLTDLLSDLGAVGERGVQRIAILVQNAVDRVEAIACTSTSSPGSRSSLSRYRDRSNATSSSWIELSRRASATLLRFTSRVESSPSTAAIILSRSRTEPSASYSAACVAPASFLSFSRFDQRHRRAAALSSSWNSAGSSCAASISSAWKR